MPRTTSSAAEPVAVGADPDNDPSTGGIELDALDQEIIGHLQEDGRRPYREIARALGVAEGTIRWRVRRLVDAQALRIVAIADPFRLGYRVLAFVLLSVEPGANERVIEALAAFPEVTYVSACTGRFDIYIQVVCRDHDQLYELLSERIPAIGGVERSETFTELKMHKIAYRYPALAPRPGAWPEKPVVVSERSATARRRGRGR